jgi:hypothetical protein
MDLRIKRGKDERLSIQVLDDTTPLDITWCTVYMHVKKSISDTALALELTATLTTPETWNCYIDITSEETWGLEQGKYYFELRLKDVGNNLVPLGEDIDTIYILDSLKIPS